MNKLQQIARYTLIDGLCAMAMVHKFPDDDAFLLRYERCEELNTAAMDILSPPQTKDS